MLLLRGCNTEYCRHELQFLQRKTPKHVQRLPSRPPLPTSPKTHPKASNTCPTNGNNTTSSKCSPIDTRTQYNILHGSITVLMTWYRLDQAPDTCTPLERVRYRQNLVSFFALAFPFFSPASPFFSRLIIFCVFFPTHNRHKLLGILYVFVIWIFVRRIGCILSTGDGCAICAPPPSNKNANYKRSTRGYSRNFSI